MRIVAPLNEEHNDELQAKVSVSQHCFQTTQGSEANRKNMSSVNLAFGVDTETRHVARCATACTLENGEQGTHVF